MAENSTKIILLKLYEFLLRETDSEHPISRIELAERLREQGVPCHVRTISRDIAALNEFGYEVGSFMRDHERYYYVPERDFSIPELKIMMDAIHAANFVTEKKTEDLTNRIAALGGSHSKTLLKRNSKDFNSRKHSNETILYSVDSIEAALQKKKKVSFCYFDLDEKAKRIYRTRENGERKRYTVDPIALVLNDDNYYLVAYNEHHPEDRVIFRVDRMMEVAIADFDQSKEASEMSKTVSRYTRQAFKMHRGDLTAVTLQFHKSQLGPVFDQFGEQTKVRKIDADAYSITVQVLVSKTFFAWLVQFGINMKIVKPDSVREQYFDHLKRIIENNETNGR